MNDKEILAGAPDGAISATHIDKEYWYWSFNGHGCYVYNKIKPGWYAPTWDIGLEEFRSLTDIRALVEKDERIKELEKELNKKSLHFVGYTNGYQIAYAKEDQGSFYVNTDNDCYIPVYMLSVHLHRLGGTASEEWMTVLQAKQLREGVTNE